jgi:hypothetical protein
MLEQGARHHPIVGGVVSSVVVPAVGMVVAGPVGAITAGATYGAVEHGTEGIPAGAIRGAIYAALAPTAGEALGVNPEGLGGTITGLNGPSLLNQLGVSSAPAIGGGIGLFGNLGELGLVEQTLAPTIQIASSTTAPIVVTSTTPAQSINLTLTAVEAVSSVAPVVGYYYANQLTEPRTTSALQSEQRKKRRKDFYRNIVGMGFGTFVASVSAPFLFAGQSSFVIALGEGAIFGGIASGVSRRNAAQGAFEGAFFAGLGNIIDSGLSRSEYLSEAKRLREALGAAASSTVYIVVHDGKLEDILIGAGSSALSNFLVPSVTGSVNEEILRVFVTGTVTSLIHRTELAQSLVAAGLGSVQARIQRIARQYGHDMAMSRQDRRHPRLATSDKSEQHKAARRTHTQDKTPLSKELNVAIDEATRVLSLHGVNLPRKKLIAMFKTHPDLKVSPKGIEDSLVKLGWLGNNRIGIPISKEDALIRGVQQFVYHNRGDFLKEARSSSVNFGKAQSNKATAQTQISKHDNAWRTDALDFATQKASEMLANKGIEVPNGRVRRAFEREALLQGSREQVQKNLIALGKVDGPVRNNESAFKRGLEKVFVSVLDSLVGKAYAGEIGAQRTLVHQNVRNITDNILDHSGNLILHTYNAIDSFLKESHRLIDEADKRRESVYQQHPQLRQYEHYYREGIQRFKTVVPDNPMGIVSKAGVVAAIPISGKVTERTVRGMQLTYRWYTAKRSTKEAFNGGRYAGQGERFFEQSIISLQKSIKKFEKNIGKHEKYIKDPSSHCNDWDKMTKQHQESLLHHWKEDIQRQATYKEMAKQILKEKLKEEAVLQPSGVKHGF